MTVPTQGLEQLQKRLAQLEEEGALETTAAVLQLTVTPQYLVGPLSTAKLVTHISPALKREPLDLSPYATADRARAHREKTALYRERFGEWHPNITLVDLTALQGSNGECYVPGKTTFFHVMGLVPPKTHPASALPEEDHTNFLLFEDELHLDGVVVRPCAPGAATARILASELRDRIVSKHSAVKAAIP